MFINRAMYERLLADLESLTETLADERQELGLERGRREVLTQQTAIQKSFIDFLISRVNQLEVERTLLLRPLINIDLPTPVLRQTTTAPPADAVPDLSIFEDDPRHAPAGWHPDGSVNYAGAPAMPTGGMT
jgi:hypothetical protein